MERPETVVKRTGELYRSGFLVLASVFVFRFGFGSEFEVRSSAFGVRRSAFGVRRSRFGHRGTSQRLRTSHVCARARIAYFHPSMCVLFDVHDGMPSASLEAWDTACADSPTCGRGGRVSPTK